MKKVLFFLMMIVMASFFFAACGTEDDPGLITDEDTATDSDSTADKDSSQDKDATPDADADSAGGCESSSRKCDKNETKACSDVDAKWTSGDAECNADCSGWDTSECKSATKAYGTLSGNGNFPFIADDSKISDQSYQQAHQNAFVMPAPFSGTYGSSNKPIPAPAQYTFALALHVPADGQSSANVYIDQMSQNDTVISPLTRISFPSDSISNGDMGVNGLLTEGDAFIFVGNIVNGNQLCFLAVAADGTLSVTGATNTTKADGGTLAFSLKQVNIYHPTAFPTQDGVQDISADLEQMGAQVCPIE